MQGSHEITNTTETDKKYKNTKKMSEIFNGAIVWRLNQLCKLL